MAASHRWSILLVAGVVGFLAANPVAEATGIPDIPGVRDQLMAAAYLRVLCGAAVGLLTLVFVGFWVHQTQTAIAWLANLTGRPGPGMASTLVVCGTLCLVATLWFEWYVSSHLTLRFPGGNTLVKQHMPARLQDGTGVRLAVISTLGTLEETGEPFDLAIQGEGFFQLWNPIDGIIHYTRNGEFYLNAQGQIVSVEGFFLEPAMTVPPDALSTIVGEGGVVSVLLPQQIIATQIGQITLARFVNPKGLVSEGQGRFAECPASGPPLVSNPGLNGNGGVLQGFRFSQSTSVDAFDALAPLMAQIVAVCTFLCGMSMIALGFWSSIKPDGPPAIAAAELAESAPSSSTRWSTP